MIIKIEITSCKFYEGKSKTQDRHSSFCRVHSKRFQRTVEVPIHLTDLHYGFLATNDDLNQVEAFIFLLFRKTPEDNNCTTLL